MQSPFLAHRPAADDNSWLATQATT